MIGTDSLLINNNHTECRGFFKLFTATLWRVEEIPFDKVEICSDLSNEDIRRTETLFTRRRIKTTGSSENMVLKLKLPDIMVGPDSLIIDILLPECRWFLNFFRKSETKLLCSLPFSVVEIQSDPLDSWLPWGTRYGNIEMEEIVNQMKFFIEGFTLKMRMPDCMLGSNGLVISMRNKKCRNMLIYESLFKVEVESPFSVVEKICDGWDSNFDIKNMIENFIYRLNSNQKIRDIL